MAGERRSTARAAAAASDGEAGMRWLRAIGQLPRGVASWLGERFEFEDSVMAVLRHPVPRELERPVGWWYVLGSATLGIFVMQVVTGVGLAMTYVPAPNSAYDSLQFISHGATLTRFYATHVFLIPAAVFGLIGLHLYLVVKRGISEPPVPGIVVDRRTYRARYEAMLARGIPFWPDAAWRDAIVATAAVAVVFVLAAIFGAPELGKPPDPTNVLADPRPDWYFLGYFAVLALIPPATESIVIVGLPLFAFVFLFLVPLLWPDGERHWSRRPAAVAAVALPFVAYAALTVAGIASPWVPKLQGGTLPASVTQSLTVPESRGADLFVSKACFACHAIEGAGGSRGPDLSHVASRLNRDQLTARIATGGGGMPAFAGSVTPSELDDLTAFLLTRH